jgi:AcrR family transcriptional regulator
MNTGKRRYFSTFRKSLRDKTRMEILSHATRLLRKIGPEGFTFELLARESGVGLRTVFRHFASRGELVSEVMVRIVADTHPLETRDLASILAGACQVNESLGQLAVIATLSDDLVDQVATVLQVTPRNPQALAITALLSPVAWHVLRGKHALTVGEASDCIAWAIEQLTGRRLVRSVPAPQVNDEHEEEFID